MFNKLSTFLTLLSILKRNEVNKKNLKNKNKLPMLGEITARKFEQTGARFTGNSITKTKNFYKFAYKSLKKYLKR